jgi:hypothetical protein
MCWPMSGFMRFGGVAMALGGVALLHWLPARTWKPMAMAGAIAVWPLLAVFEPRMRAETNRNFRNYLRTGNGKSLGDAILALEALPAGAGVTRFSNDAYLNSPIFGRSWQLHPIFTDNAGITLLPLHTEFHANPALLLSGRAPRPLPGSRQFISNLRSAGVSDVFVTKFNGVEWPPQQALLKESGEAVESFDDGDSALWHLTAPSQ